MACIWLNLLILEYFVEIVLFWIFLVFSWDFCDFLSFCWIWILWFCHFTEFLPLWILWGEFVIFEISGFWFSDFGCVFWGWYKTEFMFWFVCLLWYCVISVWFCFWVDCFMLVWIVGFVNLCLVVVVFVCGVA